MSLFRRGGRVAVAVVAITGLLLVGSGVGLPAAGAVTGLGAPTLTPASDTGSSSTDNITRAADLALNAVGTLGAGEKWQLVRNPGASEVLVGAQTTTSPITDTAVPEGTVVYVMRVMAADATTVVATSAATTVTVDRMLPVAPVVVLSAASDTGRSNTDGIASVLNQATGTFGQTWTLTITGEPNATLTATRSVNGATAAASTLTPTVLSAAGSVNASNALGNVLPSLAPVNGTYAYNVRQTDVAGNLGTAVGTATFTLDTVPPVPAVVTLDPTTDTGPSNTDAVTRWDTAAVTGTATNLSLKINVTGEPEARVELRRNGAVVTAPSTPFDLPAGTGTTTGQITDPGPFPFTAVHGYTADLADKAGNVSNGAAGFTVDLDNPALPTKPDLVVSSDLGTSDGDDITSDNTPTLNITGAEETATVFVYRCPGAVACSSGAAGNRILLGTRVGNGEFTAPVTPDNSTANTSWRFAVGQRDLSGRYSGGQVANFAEPAGLSVHVNVVIDTVAEPAPAAPVRIGGSSVSPTFNISKGTGRVQLLRDGVLVGASVGAGDITDPGPLANGTYAYTARSIDAAGNISASSAATSITVANGLGYWLLGADGGVFSFGNAPFFGSTGDMTLNAPVMAMAPTPSKDGYWLLARDGGVFAFGGAGFFGSTGDQVLNSPIVGMVPTPTGKGYWLFAEDGGVFAFGDAPFHGSAGGAGATAPVVAMLATKDGTGYWLVDKKGKIYAFGSAQQMTGVDGLTLNSPVVGFAATPTDSGLWLVAADGGIFAIGDAVFHGSAGDIVLNRPIIGMLALPDGGGYLLLASDGGVFTYGAATFLGSTGDLALNAPIVGIAST